MFLWLLFIRCFAFPLLPRPWLWLVTGIWTTNWPQTKSKQLPVLEILPIAYRYVTFICRYLLFILPLDDCEWCKMLLGARMTINNLCSHYLTNYSCSRGQWVIISLPSLLWLRLYSKLRQWVESCSVWMIVQTSNCHLLINTTNKRGWKQISEYMKQLL